MKTNKASVVVFVTSVFLLGFAVIGMIDNLNAQGCVTAQFCPKDNVSCPVPCGSTANACAQFTGSIYCLKANYNFQSRNIKNQRAGKFCLDADVSTSKCKTTGSMVDCFDIDHYADNACTRMKYLCTVTQQVNPCTPGS